MSMALLVGLCGFQEGKANPSRGSFLGAKRQLASSDDRSLRGSGDRDGGAETNAEMRVEE